jgi:hypothetical protein
MKDTFFNCKGKYHRYIYFIIAGMLLGSFFGSLIHSVANADTIKIWNIVERGDTWNKYQFGNSGTYRIDSYSDLINYKDEFGIYKPINLSHLILQPDSSYIFDNAPYRVIIDKTLGLLTIYPDRNNLNKYVIVNLSSIKVFGTPFYLQNHTFIPIEYTIRWVFGSFNIQMRFDNSKFFFEYVMKTSQAPKEFSLIVYPYGMTYSEIPFLNIMRDANGLIRNPTVTYNYTTHIMKISINAVGLTYPITVDPSINIYSSTSDCHIYVANTNYNTVRNATSGTISNTTSNTVGQTKVSTTYTVYRDTLYFNTNNVLPSSSTVAAISLNLYCSTFATNTMVVIQKDNNDTISPHNPPTIYDYNRVNYSGDGGSLNGVGISNLWASIPLNATGLSWVNYTGITKFMLRSIKEINGLIPTTTERWIYRSANYPSNTYDPYLSITFTLYVNTSVNPVYYIQTSKPININITNQIHTSKVELLYRHALYTNLYNLSNAFFNHTLIRYADGCDNAIVWEGGQSTTDNYFQTFTVPYDCYFGNLSIWAKKDISTATYYVMFYDCNALGRPLGNYLGMSSTSSDADIGTNYGWVQVNSITPIFFKASTLYGFSLNVDAQWGFPPDPMGHVWVGYNESHLFDYTGGSRWDIPNMYPPQYNEYPLEDFIFKINFSWLYYANDTTSPFSFSFNPPRDDGIYQLKSYGYNVSYGVYEDFGLMKDTDFVFVEKGGFVPDDNWLNLEGLSIESDLLFLGIALSLWIFFVSKYLENRDKTNSLMIAYMQFGFMFPLDLILADFFILHYPFFFVMVLLIPILSIYMVVDSIYYQKKNKR